MSSKRLHRIYYTYSHNLQHHFNAYNVQYTVLIIFIETRIYNDFQLFIHKYILYLQK